MTPTITSQSSEKENRITILHIEDDSEFGDLTAEFLQREDERFNVITETSATDGLKRLISDSIDCIVSDYQMPGMDGLEFLEAVREEHADLPFILFTGRGSEEIASDAIAAGVTDYLQKGSGTDQYTVLANRIKNAVDQHRTRQTAQRERIHRSALFENTPDPILKVAFDDKTPIIDGVNTAFEEVFSFDEQAVVGQSVTDMLVPESERDEHLSLRDEVFQGTPVEAEVRRKTNDGPRDFRLRIIPVDLSDMTRGAYAWYTDITERKQRVQELRTQKETITALHDVAIELETCETPTDLYQKLVDAGEQVLGYDCAIVRTVEDDTLEVQSLSTEISTDEYRERTPLDAADQLAIEVYRAGETCIVEDLLTRDSSSTAPPYRSAVTAPIGDYGVFQALAEETNAFDSIDRELAMLLAAHAQTRLAQLEREQQLLRYEGIIEEMQDVAFVIDDDGTVDFVNERVEAVTGLSRGKITGRPISILTEEELTNDAQASEFEEEARGVLYGENDEVTVELPIRLDGEGIPHESKETILDVRLAAMEGVNDRPQIIGIARNITEQKEHERVLNALHEATRELVEAATVEQAASVACEAADDILDFPMNGIHLYDEDIEGLVPVAVSDASRELLGEVPVIDEGIAWEAFQRGEARIYDDVREAQNVLDPETPMRSEIHLPLDDHGMFIVSSPEADAFDDSDIELARTLAANTEAALERINREQELRTREAALERKNERLDEFASIVSHDLRNPLNIAEGRLKLAREECDSDHLPPVADALDRMSELIEDTLSLARQGETVDETEPIDLPEFLNNCWRNVETTGAYLTIDDYLRIRGDPERLRSLFENLFRNAIEHGGEGVTVRVGNLDTAGFFVADDGPGIPEDDRADVFDPGYSTADTGSGFGLTIVKQIVEAHGWEIDVVESSDGGARFEVSDVELVE